MNRTPLCWLSSVVALAILAGCVSVSAPSGEISDVFLVGPLGGAPEWVSRFPDNPAYYIGIGSSNSGDKSRDMEEARKKALSNLAASISTEIHSEQIFTAREDSDGNSYRNAQLVINEAVNQNLREVEIVDSYHTSDDGYWFYMRLNKSVWEEIKRQEIGQLESRVRSLIEPVLRNPDVSVSSRLATLWKGWDLLAISPYASVLESQLDGHSGMLIDLIEFQMVSLIDALTISIEPALFVTEPGRYEEGVLAVQTTGLSAPGSFYVNIAPKEASENVIASMFTEHDGTFRGEVDLARLPPGRSTLTAVVDFSRFGIDLARIPKQMLIPKRDLLVDVQQIKAGLHIVEPEGSELQNTFSLFKAILGEKLPFTFATPGSEDRYLVTVTIQMRNTPKTDEGLFFSYQKVYVAVERAGRSLYVYESPEVKDGGIRADQAQNRAISKLIEALREDEELLSGVLQTLSYE